MGRIGIGAAVVAAWAGGAMASPEQHLGPLAQVVGQAVYQPWQAYEDGGWFVLHNPSADDQSLSITVPVGPAPAEGRRIAVNVTIVGSDPTSTIGIFAANDARGGACIVEITAARVANLICGTPGNYQNLGSLQNAARLDGSDVIEMLEVPGAARFIVNGQIVGDVGDLPALGGDVGVMAYDRGTFGVTGFVVEGGQPPAGGALPPPGGVAQGGGQQGGGVQGGGQQGDQDAELRQIIGPLVEPLREKPLRDPWQVYTRDGWFVLENASAAQDAFGYAAEVDYPQGGRLTSAYFAVLPASGMQQSEITNSSIGITFQDRDKNESCVAEITGGGDAVLTCFPGNETREIARLRGAAKLDGSDVIAVLEQPGTAEFYVNEQFLGRLDAHPAQGGQLGVIAYDRGAFFVTGFQITELQDDGTGQGGGQGGGQSQQGGGQAGSYDQPQGPIPFLEQDSARATATYLGVITGILLHEFGHALIGELQLPSTGPEEDAVDIYSALRLSTPEALSGDTESSRAINEGMATYAALHWYYSGMVREQQGGSGTPWQDEHTADLKRFRNTFCVMYGGNPQRFVHIAQQVGMEEQTLYRCEEEFAKQNRAWRTILAPYTRVSARHPEGMQPANAPGAPIQAVFEPSTRNVGHFVKAIIGDSGTLQGYLDGLATDYVLPRQLPVTFKDCEVLNAWYDPRQGSITMCYELIEYIVTMISDIELGTVNGYPAQGGGGSGQQPQQGGQGGQVAQAPTGGGAFDELVDMGVPVTMSLFPAPYNGPTPNGIPAAQIITTEQLAGLFNANVQRILIDTRGGGQTLPDAWVVPEAGRDGSVTDGFQQSLGAWLQEQTGGNPNVAIVYFGAGPMDRSSYNAAVRTGNLGYSQVYWYRGGREAWVANGLPLYDPPR